MFKKTNFNAVICVVGLGYVGLPLACEFGKSRYKTYGFDVNEKRINTLNKNYDYTNEIPELDLKKTDITYSNKEDIINKSNFIIVAVPTPVDIAKKPDLTLIENASIIVGENLKRGSVVVYESTVYPGVTEDICLPILENKSGLKCGIDFKIGYSPERINPGDKTHTVDKIVKVVSGQDNETLEIIADVYSEIITAGVHKAPTIKTAEAAKVIENTQRDINIGLINELATIFHKMNINTSDVLEAASTKWNFLRFTPGLVGGHCIGVDPYYLVHKAQMLGIKARLISAGRSINDSIPYFIANRIVKMLVKQDKKVNGAKLLIMGLTFKENVPDFRNSKCKELVQELQSFGIEVIGCDPYINENDTKREFNVKNINIEKLKNLDGIIYAVDHNEFHSVNLSVLENICNKNPILFDIKNRFKQNIKSKFLVEYL